MNPTNHRRSTLLILSLATFAAIVAVAQPVARAAADLPSLHNRFRNPPDDARPLVRWWWFGPAVSDDEIKRELTAMKAGGFGGFELQNTYPLATGTNPPGVTNLRFLSPDHLSAIRFTAEQAKAMGLRMDLTLGSGWPYGGATTPIDMAAGRLRIVKAASRTGAAPPPPVLRDGETLIGSASGKGGVTFFIAGRTGMKVKRPALGAEGFVVDHLDVDPVRHFLGTVAAPALDACGADVPWSLFCDSLECSGEDWTPRFLEEFQKRRGYDLRPLLPALVNDNFPNAAEVRHDWGQTLTELFNDKFVGPMVEFAHSHHSRFRIQGYGSPSAGEYSYLGVDLPEGEGYQWHDYRATRYASSAAHLMGVPVSSSETFTWLHPPVFRATPLDIKAEADLHFLQGVNQIICHGWPYSPPQAGEPGWSFYAAGVFNDHNPWWTVMPEVTAYLSRGSGLLRQGRPANDIAVYLANDDAWAHFSPGHVSLSDNVGKDLGPTIVGTILDAGYNLDFFDDQLLAARGRVEGDALAFGDLRYKVVVLAGVERVPPVTMATLEAFVKGGGTLIATRTIPSRAPGYRATAQDQQTVIDIAARLFKGEHPPALFVSDEQNLRIALAGRLKPDVAFDPAMPAIGFVHRHTDAGEIYFLANTSNGPVRATVHFRAARAIAEQWDLVTGATEPIPVAGGSVPLALDAYGSTVIFFPADAPAVAPEVGPAVHVVERRPVPGTDLSDGWSIQFPGAAPTPMSHLHSWTDDPATRTFSGVATYTRRLIIDPSMVAAGQHVAIDFGPAKPRPPHEVSRASPGFAADLDPPVAEAAVVYVNGRRAGAVWCPPYSLDVTSVVRAGDNDLRVEVANTAVNALADGRFPNYDYAALTAAFGRRFDPAKSDTFQPAPSGLLGPIMLTTTPAP